MTKNRVPEKLRHTVKRSAACPGATPDPPTPLTGSAVAHAIGITVIAVGVQSETEPAKLRGPGFDGATGPGVEGWLRQPIKLLIKG